VKTVYIVLTTIVLAAGAPALANESRQSAGLRLEGKVISVKRTARESSDLFDVDLELEFINSGEKPIILLRGTYDEGKWWLVMTQLSVDPTDDKTSLHIGGGTAPNSRSMRIWRTLRKQLDRPLPPKGLTYVVAPGEKVVYRLSTFVILSGDDRKMVDRNLWLRVRLEMWPFNLEAIGRSDLQNELRRRWAKQGILWVDSIISDPIQISLRQ
jgi:hypothetical protein